MISTYILSSYAALQTVDHADTYTIEQLVIQFGGTAVRLPSTVVAVLDSTQYARLTVHDAPMANDANMISLLPQ